MYYLKMEYVNVYKVNQGLPPYLTIAQYNDLSSKEKEYYIFEPIDNGKIL